MTDIQPIPEYRYGPIRQAQLHTDVIRGMIRENFVATTKALYNIPTPSWSLSVGLTAMDSLVLFQMWFSGNEYFDEICKVSRLISGGKVKDDGTVEGGKVIGTGVFAANFSFEWAGCTTRAFDTAQGPVLVRTFDWYIKELQGKVIASTTTSEDQKGSCVQFGFLGLSGVVQAVVPGKFAIAINQAPVQRYVTKLIDSPFTRKIDTFISTSLAITRRGTPPLLLARKICDEARKNPSFGYNQALKMIETTGLTHSVIFTLVGVKEGQFEIVERSPTKAARIPKRKDGSVAANNASQTGLIDGRPRGPSGRIEAICATHPQDLQNADLPALRRTLEQAPTLNDETVLAMATCPGTGGIDAVAWKDGKPVGRYSGWKPQPQ